MVLLPAIFQKKLRHIGFFSLFVLIFTFLAIVIIAYMSWDVYAYKKASSHDSLEYKYMDVSNIPVFCASMMTLFEGNQQILNLYAETNKPKKFYAIVTSSFVFLLIAVAICVGILGYLAYGDKCMTLILYNLPN